MNDKQHFFDKLSNEEREVLDAFQELRRTIEKGERQEAKMLLYTLERMVVDSFVSLHEQAVAVADANARSIEIMDRQMTLTDELKEQNCLLEQQKEELERARLEFETQGRSAADAAVDAVFMLEESEKKISDLENFRLQLKSDNEALNVKMVEVEREAVALANANVEAMNIIEEREKAVNELVKKQSEMETTSKELERAAFLDSLTGLFNHRYFKNQMEYEMARVSRYNRELTLIFFDIDHFKKINDTHGHVVGDEVLKTLGDLIKSQIRTADIPLRMESKAFAARYGGEEFVIILPETDVENGYKLAERIRHSIEVAPISYGSTQPLGSITVSGGVAKVMPDEKMSDVVERADAALYQAKESGRNQVVMAQNPK